ncbi:MAG: phosphoribosylamine--glycine ligase [Deltaproteobacteria bacterium]|nr:phosphoribosylamine--glycine ligase [Deltaproteobacteria bacterium]NND28419.1 phosphoribosylamine--glycine ligase [Myxococcales bacterium]MBT8464172.1 phosphoribosylamine--glycine ligase [Deltaproteobacteria bacterium]MBT8483398.1 phosphoribosylamine--glycine ligase [Deltaproteobacteria bacterium]NNK08760.1 phosphoribosylamine--glycine ligase [Myxococcales bacterium]
MQVLIVGAGAREHALAWRLSQESEVEVIGAPGNAGIAAIGRTVPVDSSDADQVVALAKKESADLVVVGPEAPLVAGVVDALRSHGIDAFGPSREAAQLEGSKIFSKEFMARHSIPTAGFAVFDDPDTATRYIEEANRPLVVKADGLAAGKGVIVAKTAAEAIAAVDRIMRERAFGSAGDRVLIEECLVGEEVSYHVVSDGKRFIPLAPAQDHKRAFDGDQGPNTGGMGAYSPPPVVTREIERKILEQVVEPTLAGMADEGRPFRGALFVGLMVVDGEPLVLEYNTRFGDPECQTLMTRWKGSILPLVQGSARGDFGELTPEWEAPASLCVVLAAGGYPGSYEKGTPIHGLDAASALPNVMVFHAGTALRGDSVVTAGGRVLSVTAIGDSVDQAADRAYEAVGKIDFEGKQLRQDIGWRARRG